VRGAGVAVERGHPSSLALPPPRAGAQLRRKAKGPAQRSHRSRMLARTQRRNPTNSASVIAPRQRRALRSRLERKRRHTIPPSPEQHPLTVKLRGRTTTPDKRRGRTLSSRARGAKQTTHHGPLERLLEGAQPTGTFE